jgi:AraC-like DNA-binding protein
MALTLIIFLPVAVCLFWLVLTCLLTSKTETFHEMVCLCLACGIYLFSDACHATQVNGSPLDTGSLIVALFAGPCIIPLIIMYLQKLIHHRKRHYLTMLWVMIPTMLFTGGILLYYLKFDERVNQAFEIIVGPVFHGVLACELVVLLIYIIRLLTFSRILKGSVFSMLFKGKPISLARLQIGIILAPLSIMVIRIAVVSDNLYTAQPWAATLSAVILGSFLFIFALNSLFGMKATVTLKDLRYIIRFNYNRENKMEVVESIINELIDEAEEEALKRIQERIGENLHLDEWHSGNSENMPKLASHIFSAVSQSWDEDSLISRFQHLMMDEQMFLMPRLTLDDVADRLHSNKTYVSKMVNNTYNLGFPELINILRVDYAEQYILAHRDAKQEEIAQECGFLSASSFNTIFKKVTGTTPKVWLASMDRNGNN